MLICGRLSGIYLQSGAASPWSCFAQHENVQIRQQKCTVQRTQRQNDVRVGQYWAYECNQGGRMGGCGRQRTQHGHGTPPTPPKQTGTCKQKQAARWEIQQTTRAQTRARSCRLKLPSPTLPWCSLPKPESRSRTYHTSTSTSTRMRMRMRTSTSRAQVTCITMQVQHGDL